jgi:P27 family predicted phage terminase small subunit
VGIRGAGLSCSGRGGTPEPPEWLSEEAKAEWRRVTPELTRLGVLSPPLDRGVLTMYCDAWAKWVAAGKALDDEGLLSQGYRSGLRKHPLYEIWRAAANLADALAKELAHDGSLTDWGLIPRSDSTVRRSGMACSRSQTTLSPTPRFRFAGRFVHARVEMEPPHTPSLCSPIARSHSCARRT